MLFEFLDGGEVPLSEARVFVQTIQTENYSARQSTDALSTAFVKIVDNDPKVAKHYAKHINRLTTVFNLAGTGHYQSSGILLRNCIEAFLRSNFLFLNEYADANNFPELSRYSEWENAISHDPGKALSIGPMCKLIKKMGFAKPIRNPYHFLKIDTLNELAHAHLSILNQSEDNTIRRRSLELQFDREYFRNFVSILQRFVEFQLVVWQHLSDRTKKIDTPLIPLSRSRFQKYNQLLMSTRSEYLSPKQSDVGCNRCRILEQEVSLFSEDDIFEFLDQIRHGREVGEAGDEVISKFEKRDAEENKKLPPIKRARIEPGKIVAPCPNNCGNGDEFGGWTLLVYEMPKINNDNFSCSQGLRHILPNDPSTGIPCDLCGTRGVIITDCDCM